MQRSDKTKWDIHEHVCKREGRNEASACSTCALFHLLMELPSCRAARTFDSITVPPAKIFDAQRLTGQEFRTHFWGFAERKQIVGKANRVLLSFDKNHRYVPRLRRTFSSLE